MTHRANYAAFVDAIFGPGSVTFDVAKTDTNNVIGALANPTQYLEFKANFAERLPDNEHVAITENGTAF